MKIQEHKMEFRSQGQVCSGILFEPENTDKPSPCIVMAMGLGGVQEVALPSYARVFVEAGYRVLTFDYRCWGNSEGTPRQLISVPQQLQDWESAITFARTLPSVDPSRIALWGTSFSGGHVIVAAARDKNISAIVSQCPMMDGLAAVLNYLGYAGLWNSLQLSALGVLDLFRSAVGMSPIYVPTVAPSGSLGLLASDDAETGYQRTLEASNVEPYPKQACARIALLLGLYRPIRYATKIKCPTLIMVCNHDSIAPIASAIKTADHIGTHARLVRFELGHFDIYLDEGFSISAKEQLKFFQNALPLE